jgi:hypothetical protein
VSVVGGSDCWHCIEVFSERLLLLTVTCESTISVEDKIKIKGIRKLEITKLDTSSAKYTKVYAKFF